MGQEAAEQRCPLTRAVGQDLRHKAAIIVIDDRLRDGPKERECMYLILGIADWDVGSIHQTLEWRHLPLLISAGRTNRIPPTDG